MSKEQLTIEQLKEQELNLRTILDRISEAFVALDLNDCYTYVNESAAMITGRSPEELIGNHMWTEFPFSVDEPFYDAYQLAIETNEFQYVQQYFEAWDMWFEVKIFPSETGRNVFFSNVTDKKKAQLALEGSKKMMENIINSIKDGFSMLSLDGKHVMINKAFCDMLGFTNEELVGSGPPHPYWAEESMDKIVQAYENTKNGIFKDYEFYFKHKNGSLVPVIVSPSFVYDDEGNSVNMVATIKDISDRYESELRIKESEERLRAVLEASQLGIWDYNVQQDITIRTMQHDRCFGFDEYQPNWSTETFLNCIHPDDRIRVQNHSDEIREQGGDYRIEYRTIWPDGSIHWLLSAGKVIQDDSGKAVRIIGIIEEITNRKKDEIQIKESIKEKETLLAEIHHRVKNNLAVVSGLMQLQTYETDNAELIDRLNVSINRIKSIASIHEELYKSHNFSRISLKKNIEDLMQSLGAVSDAGNKVKVELDLEDVILDINQALPCALIVNEVATNAYKHAFNGMKTGKLGIHLSEKDHAVELQIRDNGKGLPDDFKPNESQSMGFNLISSLATQIDGEIEYHNEGGLVVTITFENLFEAE